MKVEELLRHLERTADPSLAAEWDSCGIQVRGTVQDIGRLAVALDPALDRIRKAVDDGADFILTHHPINLQAKLPADDDEYTSVLRTLMCSGTWLYAAHTSLDVCTHGPPSWLAKRLGLTNISALEPLRGPSQPGLKIRTSDPLDPDLLDRLESEPAILSVGNHQAGHAEILTPHEAGPWLHRLLHDKAPPISIERIQLLNPGADERGYGIIGDIEPALSWSALAGMLAAELGMNRATLAGRVPEQITRLAYCPGSGMSLAGQAFARGAQVFISGDLKYHQAQEIEKQGLVLDVGHFLLEEKMMRAWADDLAAQFGNRNIHVAFLSGHNPMRSEIFA